MCRCASGVGLYFNRPRFMAASPRAGITARLGAELKRNVKNAWWQSVVHERDDMVGLDSSILMHPKIWEHSGHLATFNDPLVDCKSCKARFRADHLKNLETCPNCGSKGTLTDLSPIQLDVQNARRPGRHR